MPSPVFLENASQLKTIFNIDDISDVYKDYQPFSDRKAGFSVKREYPKNLRYKPPVTQSGIPVTAALIGVVYAHPDDTGEPIEGTKVPIYITVDLFNKYLSDHHEYNYEDPNCPTEDSVKKSNITPKPASMLRFDGMSYDHETGALLSKKGEVISGKQVLDEAFNIHCNTIHRIKGLRYRIRKRLHGFSINLYEGFEKFCVGLLKLLGYDIQPKIGFDVLTPYKKDDLKESKTKDLNLFGYKTSRNTVVIFSFLIVFFFVLFSLLHRREFLDAIMSNSLLSVCSAIALLWGLEVPIPRILFFLHNAFFNKRIKMMLRGTKV